MEALTFHGGRIDIAMRRFPDAPRPWLDLSTGINPESWRPAVAPVVDQRSLPSVAALDGLLRVAAVAFGAPDVPIAAVPGTEMALRMLGRIGLPPPFRYVAPGYRTHGAAMPGAAGIAMGAIGEEATRGGTILLANPNNPDGHVSSLDYLLEIAHRLARRGGMLVVDEAYGDAVPESGMLPRIADAANVLVLRSFGKFFGLAGVRLGFVCGARDTVARIAAETGSWPVSATAIAHGHAAYRDEAWIAAMREKVARSAAALDAVLRTHGLVPTGGCPLFRLVERDDAGALFARLARAGILTRPFDDAPRRLRIGLPGDDASLARLDRALRDG